MPTAPLYYRPYMEALYSSIPIDDPTTPEKESNTLGQVANEQLVSYDVSRSDSGSVAITPVSSAANKFDKDSKAASDNLKKNIIEGVLNLQSELPGSAPINRFQFATSAAGAMAARMATHLRSHPDILNSMTPDGVKELGVKLVEASKQDIASSEVKFSEDVLDFGNTASKMLVQVATDGKDLSDQDAVAVTSEITREVQRAVTPQPADDPVPLSWFEDAGDIVASKWAGVTAHSAAKLGFKNDAASLEKIVAESRAKDVEGSSSIRSVNLILNDLGIDQTKPDDSVKAFDLIQKHNPQDAQDFVAQALVSNAKLPDERSSYYAQRLLSTSGDDANVQGVLDSIKLEQKSLPTSTGDTASKPDHSQPVSKAMRFKL